MKFRCLNHSVILDLLDRRTMHPNFNLLGFETMTSRSWTAHSCPWDATQTSGISHLDRSTMHSKFELTGVWTNDIQIMNRTFYDHVPEMPSSSTTQPSGTSYRCTTHPTFDPDETEGAQEHNWLFITQRGGDLCTWSILKGNLVDLEPCWLVLKHPITYICSQRTTSHHAQKLIDHWVLTVLIDPDQDSSLITLSKPYVYLTSAQLVFTLWQHS